MIVQPDFPAAGTHHLWFRNGAPLVWAQTPGEGPVFDPATGETHFLNELPALILQSIDADPVSFPTLVERLAGPVDLDEQEKEKIVAALVYLEGAELVESRLPQAR